MQGHFCNLVLLQLKLGHVCLDLTIGGSLSLSPHSKNTHCSLSSKQWMHPCAQTHTLPPDEHTLPSALFNRRKNIGRKTWRALQREGGATPADLRHTACETLLHPESSRAAAESEVVCGGEGLSKSPLPTLPPVTYSTPSGFHQQLDSQGFLR